MQKCCFDAVNDFCTNYPEIYNCRANAGGNYAPPHLMLKVIANYELFAEFSEPDDADQPDNGKLKGIEVLR